MAETNDKNELQGSAKQDFEDVIKAEELARRRARTGEKKLELAITSLMDIMTIMLVFLLVSITSDPLNVKQDTFMQLANSTANVLPKDDSIPIVITKQHIVLDNKPIVTINCSIDKSECTPQDFEKLNDCEKNPTDEVCRKKVLFEIDKQDKEKSDSNSLIIEPLRKELDRLVKQQIAEDEALGRKFKGVVTLIADKQIPFRLLMEVIYTAGKVGVKGKGGLSRFRFAILKVGAGG